MYNYSARRTACAGMKFNECDNSWKGEYLPIIVFVINIQEKLFSGTSIIYVLDQIHDCANSFPTNDERVSCINELKEQKTDAIGCLDCLCNMMRRNLGVAYGTMITMVDPNCSPMGGK